MPLNDIKLSDNFSLRELLWSDVAARDPALLNEQLDPPAPIIENLGYLVTTVLQPLREELAWPIRVSSGYRCEKLNTLVKGSATSQHKQGEAADISISNSRGFLDSPDTARLRAMCQLLYRRETGKGFPRGRNADFYLFVMIALGVEEWDVDQVIHEYGLNWGAPGWVHVAASTRKDDRRVTVVGDYTDGYEHYAALNEAATVWQEER